MGWDVAIWGLWGALFLLFEGLALGKRVPWTTLSEFTWLIEKAWPIARWPVLIGLATLTVHLVAGWP